MHTQAQSRLNKISAGKFLSFWVKYTNYNWYLYPLFPSGLPTIDHFVHFPGILDGLSLHISRNNKFMQIQSNAIRYQVVTRSPQCMNTVLSPIWPQYHGTTFMFPRHCKYFLTTNPSYQYAKKYCSWCFYLTWMLTGKKHGMPKSRVKVHNISIFKDLYLQHKSSQ